MRKIIFLISVFYSFGVQGEVLPKSFSYVRAGGYVTPIGMGVKGAVGYRLRNERWGWGPQLQVTANPIATALTARVEGLYYLKCWEGGYWGVNGGIGAANIKDIERGKGSYWGPWGTGEIVVGKEFGTTKRKFCQASLFFLPTGFPIGISFDCSTGF